MEDKLKITVLIAVRNEERNLPDCLRSVQCMDEVVVVDSNSTDQTCHIAESFGARVVQFSYDGGWPKKRNWALKSLTFRNPWVLVLDADERVDDRMRAEIAESTERDDVSGYYMRWRFNFLGRWMKHCWRHAWMLRLFRHGSAEYEDLGLRGEGGWDAEVHENLVLTQGKAGRLQSWLIHDSREDLSFWIEKQNQFSSWNAARRLQQLREPRPPVRHLLSADPILKRKWMKALFVRLPFRPTLLFLWLFVIRRGFLDGRAGWFFCRLRAIHEFNTGAKVFESLIRPTAARPTDNCSAQALGSSTWCASGEGTQGR